jgi:hypothetical protein
MESKGAPMWQRKPGILGAMAWLKFVGQDLSTVSFEFIGIATTILDAYPLAAWERLNELAAFDSSLGRPPMVLFTHGPMIVEGFITEIPEAPFEYWGGNNQIRSRIVRQIGPVRITITRVPKESTEISLTTNYVTKTEETRFEDLALLQYGDARYGQMLAVYNQGVKNEGKIEIPRKKSGLVPKTPLIAPYLDDSIEGL